MSFKYKYASSIIMDCVCTYLTFDMVTDNSTGAPGVKSDIVQIQNASTVPLQSGPTSESKKRIIVCCDG